MNMSVKSKSNSIGQVMLMVLFFKYYFDLYFRTLFIYLFYQCFLSTYHVFGIMLGTRNTNGKQNQSYLPTSWRLQVSKGYKH